MYDFMEDANAQKLFASIDYQLRSGVHIQYQRKGQEDVFKLISRFYPSLRKYYKELFGLNLSTHGESSQKYYFLEADPDQINRIPSKLRDPLDGDLVIIGLFLCKLSYIDFSEAETITDFKRLLREEYESYKADFYRLLNRTQSNTQTVSDDMVVERRVDKAFQEFNRLGWVQLEGDYFEVMPSLERLRLLYANEIDRINELIQGDDQNE